MGLMTLEEVASYLRVNKKTIYRLSEGKNIPAIKVGRLWRFSKNSIDSWLSDNHKKRIANILVIDDDDEICSLFKDTLEDSNCVVTTVNESSQGLEQITDT